MSDIDEFSERVEIAQERFRFINEVQNKHSERLINLLNSLKADLDETRREHADQQQEIARLTEANETLRGLLHNLLKAVETFNSSDALQGIERKAAGLLGDEPGATADVEASADSDTVTPLKGRLGAKAARKEAGSDGEATKAVATNGAVEKPTQQPKIPTFFLRSEAAEAETDIKTL